jgi:murein DD-endopeptidase MepM/ murein hydrolase activator NlpD
VSDRLLSEVSGHSDYSGYGSYAGYDVLDPGYGHGPGPQETDQWSAVPWAPEQPYAAAGGDAQAWYGQDPQGGYAADGGWDSGGYATAYAETAVTSPGYEPGHASGYVPDDASGYQPGYASGYEPGPAQYGGYDPEFSGDACAAGPEAAYAAPPGPVDPEPVGLAPLDLEPLELEPLELDLEPEPLAAAPLDTDAPEPVAEATPAAAARGQRGGRRRCARTRRSAFLSVAAPSLAVLGVTAVATAATVSESGTAPNEPAPVAAPDPGEVRQLEANEEFDTRLTGLTAAVDDYADRASRTQGRLDLEAQQAADAQAAADAAALAEEMRQKFFLPVDQHGLSAYFGQAGVNWMSTHTGIDFPVSYGSPVRAATDGSISTQYHPSYGNMMILTAPDGTETWYCHLSSSVYTSGWVQAGTVIAYSGNSGTSTGPHLHFEVRPGGGSPIDPLTWLRTHGLEPT